MVKFGWDKLKRFLAQANTWTGQQTFVTPALGTPASGDLKNCTNATEVNKGVTVYAGTTKALAGTDAASAMTPADTKAVLESPPDIGITTPKAGTFTTVTADKIVATNDVDDATLSGTPRVFVIYPVDGSTPYYVKAYPTKS